MKNLFSNVPLSIRILLGVMSGVVIAGGVTLAMVFRHFDQKEKEREEQRVAAMQEAEQIRAALIQAGPLLKIRPTSALAALPWPQRIKLDEFPKEKIEIVTRRKPEIGDTLMRLKTQQENEIENKPLPELKRHFQKVLLEYCRHADHENTLEAEFTLSKLKAKLPPEDDTVKKSLPELKPKELTEDEWNNFKTPRLQEIKDMFTNQTVNTERIDRILEELENKRPEFYGNDDLIPLSFTIFERSRFTKTLCMEALEKAANDYDAALKSDSLLAADLEGYVTTWNASLATLKNCAQVAVSPKPHLDKLNTVEKVCDHFLRPAWNVFYQSLRNIFLNPGSDADQAAQQAIDTLNALRKRYGDYNEPERNNYSLANWRARIIPMVLKDAHELALTTDGLPDSLDDEKRETLQEIIAAVVESCETDMNVSAECAPAEWRVIFGLPVIHFLNVLRYFKYPKPDQRRFELKLIKYIADRAVWNNPTTAKPEQIAPLIKQHAELLKFLTDNSLSRSDFAEILDPPADLLKEEQAIQTAAEELANLATASTAIAQKAQKFAETKYVCHFDDFWHSIVIANSDTALAQANKLKTAIEALPPNYNDKKLAPVLNDLLPHLKAAIFRATAAIKFVKSAQAAINALAPPPNASTEFRKWLLAKDPQYIYEQMNEVQERQKLATDKTIIQIQNHLFSLAMQPGVDLNHFRTLLVDIETWIKSTEEPNGPVILPNNDLTLQRKLLPVTAKAFYFSVCSAIKMAELKTALPATVVPTIIAILNSHFITFTLDTGTSSTILGHINTYGSDAANKQKLIRTYSSYLLSVLLNLGQQQKLLEWTTLGFYKNAQKNPFLMLLTEKHYKMGKALKTAWDDLKAVSQALPPSDAAAEAQINTKLTELGTKFNPVATTIGLNIDIKSVTELDVCTCRVAMDKVVPIYREYKKLSAKLVLLRTASSEELKHLAGCSFLEDMGNIVSKLPLVADIKQTVFLNALTNVKYDHFKCVQVKHVVGTKFTIRASSLLNVLNMVGIFEVESNAAITSDASLQTSSFITALFDPILPENSFMPYFDAIMAAQEMVPAPTK